MLVSAISAYEFLGVGVFIMKKKKTFSMDKLLLLVLAY